jgi:RNA polymerase sporulation-specific sigma factor
MLQFLLEMLSTKFLLFALHLSNTGSFPPPLNAEEEQACLLACAQGDMGARDTLIEHNLRLVVHVIKNSYYKITDIHEVSQYRNI